MSINKLIDPKIERVLETHIYPDLNKGRKDFDLPHTKAVVYWMKWLIANHPKMNKLNSKILIAAAYAHDWGYIGLFDGLNSNDPQVIAQKKVEHMTRGSAKIEKLLSEKLSDLFTREEILRTSHLVLMHDKLAELHDEDELMMMEADTMGILDVSRVKPTFSKEDNERFLTTEIDQLRLPAFIHEYAKKVATNLADQRRNFYR